MLGYLHHTINLSGENDYRHDTITLRLLLGQIQKNYLQLPNIQPCSQRIELQLMDYHFKDRELS